MTNYSNEQIYNALALIQNICMNRNDCSACPFYKRQGCAIIESGEPHLWDLIAPNELYKPFK